MRTKPIALFPWHLTILSDSTPSSTSVLLTLFGAYFHVRHKVEERARTGEMQRKVPTENNHKTTEEETSFSRAFFITQGLSHRLFSSSKTCFMAKLVSATA